MAVKGYVTGLGWLSPTVFYDERESRDSDAKKNFQVFWWWTFPRGRIVAVRIQ